MALNVSHQLSDLAFTPVPLVAAFGAGALLRRVLEERRETDTVTNKVRAFAERANALVPEGQEVANFLTVNQARISSARLQVLISAGNTWVQNMQRFGQLLLQIRDAASLPAAEGAVRSLEDGLRAWRTAAEAAVGSAAPRPRPGGGGGGGAPAPEVPPPEESSGFPTWAKWLLGLVAAGAVGGAVYYYTEED